MVTIVFRMIIKREKLAEFQSMAHLLEETTPKEDSGCLLYVFYRGVNKSHEYILYEKWKDKASLEAHLKRLPVLLGPTANANTILPKKFKDCFESTEDVLYKETE